jgi:type VI secretion system protein ImpC
MNTPEEHREGRQAGLQLGLDTGSALREQRQVPFRMLVIGDFGRQRNDSAPVGLTLRNEAPASLPEQMEVTIRCSVDNLFGSNPSQLNIELPIRQLRDFTDRSLTEKIEPLLRAAALRQAVAAGYDGLEGFADLDHLGAALHGAPPQPQTPTAGNAPVSNDADLLRSILGDGDPQPTAGHPTGLSSLIGAIAHSTTPAPRRMQPLKEQLAAVDAIVRQQMRVIRAHPDFAAVESVWRGLQLLLRQTGRETDVHIDLLDVASNDVAACLLRDVVPDELERLGEAPLSCVLVLGAVPADLEGIERLAYCAAAGAALRVPILTSLRQEFFDDIGDEIVAAWTLLQSETHSEWLAACHGDVVLDADERGTPLWGEPAWAVGALILASLARTGWPSALVGPEEAVAALGLHEVHGRSGPTMWPVRRPATAETLAQLRQLGVIAVAARANRDHVFLSAAPTVAASDPDAVSLGDQLTASWLQAHLNSATLVVSGGSDAEWAAAIGRVLGQLLPRGAHLRVEPSPRENAEAARSFKIEIAAALPGAAGRRIAFDYGG